MAETKVDLIYCNVNMSSPNSCNSSNLSHQKASDQNLSNNHNQSPRSSPQPPVDHSSNEQSSCVNNNSNHQIPQLTSKLNNKSTAKSNVKNSSTISKDEQKSEEEKDEITDQFNDFDYFERRGSIKERLSGELPANKFIETNFITNEDIGQVLKAFQDKAFRAGEYRAKDEKIQLMCINLFNYDYKPDDLMILNNAESELSTSYPSKIIVPKTKAFPIDH